MLLLVVHCTTLPTGCLISQDWDGFSLLSRSSPTVAAALQSGTSLHHRGGPTRSAFARKAGEKGKGFTLTSVTDRSDHDSGVRSGHWLRRTTRLLNDSPLVVKAFLAIAPTLAALVVLAVASLVLISQLVAFRAVAHNYTNAQEYLNQTELTVVQAETGVRGYAATDSSSFLAIYETARAQVPVELKRLRTLGSIAGQPIDQVIAPMVKLIGVEEAQLDSIRKGVQAGTLSRTALTAEMLAARATMKKLMVYLNAEQAKINGLIAKYRNRISARQTRLQVVDVAGLLIGGLGGVLGAIFIAFGVLKRITQLADNSSRIMRGQPPLPIEPSRDEIGRLSEDILVAGRLLERRNQELVTARDEAMAASVAKDNFLSRTSHELRTPLTAILGFGQLLQMDDLSADQKESVDQIVKAGHHLLDLINEVLDISRIETGRLALSLEQVFLAELVGEVATLMAPLAADRGVTIERDTPGDIAVTADRQRLKQVALNLVSNAIKYNRDAGTVTISTYVKGRNGYLGVRDTGAGIAAENLGRLFRPFDRLGADRSEIEGTGVGLSLSQALVYAMNGSIDVDSTVGSGSTFTVVLPLNTSPAGAPAPGSGEGAGTEGVILYVEDNLANLPVLERVFRPRRETLQVAVQGQMCLDVARELVPKVILLDLHLPDIPGEEVLRRLKADPATASIPVIILSADATLGSERRLIEAGAVGYVPKPIDVRRFLDTIDQLTAAPAT
jgi:signal transduction histidine kinase/CheY-like chemotaxis protein